MSACSFTYPSAVELSRKAPSFLLWGLIAAAAIHFSVAGSYRASLRFEEPEPPDFIKIDILKVPPPPIVDQPKGVAPAVSPVSHTKPPVGIPVPVPDTEVNPEQTFPTQAEMYSDASPTLGEGEAVSVTGGDEIRIDEPPPPFVPGVERLPMVVHQVAPGYPELARRAGIEGCAWFKAWVDREGKVRAVEITKSDSELFNQSVIDAVTQWTFTPALSAGGPVDVWVSMPCCFRLRDK
jgi:protein TonB